MSLINRLWTSSDNRLWNHSRFQTLDTLLHLNTKEFPCYYLHTLHGWHYGLIDICHKAKCHLAGCSIIWIKFFKYNQYLLSMKASPWIKATKYTMLKEVWYCQLLMKFMKWKLQTVTGSEAVRICQKDCHSGPDCQPDGCRFSENSGWLFVGNSSLSSM